MNNKRLNILVIPYIIPYPANDGGKVCTFGFIDFLRKKHDFTVLFQAYSESDLKNLEILKALWPEVTIEVHSYVQRPEEISLSKAFRNFTLKQLCRLKHKVLLLAGIRKKEPSTADAYYAMITGGPANPSNFGFASKISELVSHSQFDIIQVENTENLNLVHLLPSHSKKIFVQFESRFEVLEDYVTSYNLKGKFYEYVISNMKFLEHSYFSKYDAIFTLNESEKDFLKKELHSEKVFNSPYGILQTDILSEMPSDNSYYKFTLLGADSHFPNLDALDWYVHELMEPISKIADFNIEVIGNWSQENRNKYSSYPNIIFRGFVDDLEVHLKNSILLVPVRIGGGGVRSKILSAMALGVPVISTSLAAVGIHSSNKNILLIADSVEEFCERVSFALNHPEAVLEMSQVAYQFINNRYSQKYTSELREKYYYEILA